MGKTIIDFNEALQVTGLPKHLFCEFIRTNFIPNHIIGDGIFFELEEIETWMQEIRRKMNKVHERQEPGKSGHAATCVFYEDENKKNK
jgi:hypothetical protein